MMQDITNLINTNDYIKKENKNNIKSEDIFNIMLLDIFLALLNCVKFNKSNSLVLESSLKESKLKFIQLYKHNIEIHYQKEQHFFYINKRTIFYKKDKKEKFNPITKENEIQFLNELNVILQQENSYILWKNVSTETDKIVNFQNTIKLNELKKILIQHNYRLLKNKKENFDTPFTNYLYLKFQKRHDNQIKKILNEINTQFNLMLKEENKDWLTIANSTNETNYSIKISKNLAKIIISNFDTNNYITINFNTFEIYLNNTLQNLSYFKELSSFFETLNYDTTHNLATISFNS